MTKSPYNLLQEIYYPDEWKILISCIFLNLTSRVQVDRVRDSFFERWPDAKSVNESDFEEMSEMLAPLGFRNKRANTIIRFSREFIEKKWKDPIELHGIGKYGQDSYDIFIRNIIVDNPSDHVLKKYLEWKVSD
jgi:methyl-CpG-binding domain protein 4